MSPLVEREDGSTEQLDRFAASDSPAPVPAAIPGQSAGPGPQIYNRGVSASFSGYDPNKIARAEGRLEGNYAEAEADGQRLYQGLAQPYVDASNARADNVITAEEAQGAPSMYAAQEHQRQGQIQAQVRQAKMYADFAAEEHRANQFAMAKVAQAKQEYLSQVQTYQAMSVNPGQLMGNMSAGGRAATFASVFVNGFLGARGVKTNVMDTINRAIDQNIDAQKANIDKQGNVAEHFKALYQMAVNESATEQEARTRMRGFYLAQMEKEITAELLKYDAPLARAKAAEARLMFQEEQAKNLIEVGKFVDGRVMQAKQQALQLREIEGREAMHRQSLAVQYAQLDQEQQKIDAAKGPQDLTEQVYYNPLTGKAEGIIVSKDAGTIERVRASASAAMDMEQKVGYFKALMRAKHQGVFDGPGAQAWRGMTGDQLSNMIEAAHNDIAYTLAKSKDPGKLAKDDVEAAKKMMPLETKTTTDMDKVASQVIKLAHDSADAYSRSHVIKMSPQQKAQYAHQETMGTQTQGNYYTEAQNDLSGNDQPISTPTQDALDAAQRPNADKGSNIAVAAQAAINKAYENQAQAPQILGQAIEDLQGVQATNMDFFSDTKAQADMAAAIDQLSREYERFTGQSYGVPNLSKIRED